MDKKIEFAYAGVNWFIGEREGSKLKNPRIYLFSGNQHAIMNLPGNPKVIQIDNAAFWYKCDDEISALYMKQVEKSEHPNIIVPEKKIEVVQ